MSASITTTLGALVDASTAARALAEQKLPIAVSVQAVRLLRAMGAEIDLFEQRRLALAQEHGTLSSDKQTYMVPPEHQAAFMAAVRELCAVPSTVAAAPIAFASLPDTLTISPADLMLLSAAGVLVLPSEP